MLVMDTGRDVHTMWVTSLEMVILYWGFKKSVLADLLSSTPDFTLGALSSALKLPSCLAFLYMDYHHVRAVNHFAAFM